MSLSTSAGAAGCSATELEPVRGTAMRRVIVLTALGVLAVISAAAAEGPQVAVEVGPKRVASWGSHPGHVSHPRHTILATKG